VPIYSLDDVITLSSDLTFGQWNCCVSTHALDSSSV